MKIETTIYWKKPKDVVPPFGQEILVLVCGQECSNGVWKKYLKLIEVVISKKSPADYKNKSEFRDFGSGQISFTECQFYLKETHVDSDFVSCEDPNWFSDDIVLWAESPLSEMVDLVHFDEIAP